MASDTIVPAPNAIASMVSGLVRRHSNVGISATTRGTVTARLGRFVRSRPSRIAAGTSTATSAQSHQSGPGGSAGAGSSQMDRRRRRTASS
jgi:hypothetical protein